MRHRIWGGIGIVALLGLALGASRSLAAPNASTSIARPLTASTPLPAPPQNVIPVISSRAQAIAMVTADAVHLSGVTRAEAKETTVAALLSAPGYQVAGAVRGSWETDPGQASRLIWVVAVAGTFTPDVPGLPDNAAIPTDDWVAFVIGAGGDGGGPIASTRAGSGGWPPFFDSLTDHARS